MELPFQQTKAELWDEVTDTLCNLDFIQAKACAGLIRHLIMDFHSALIRIPDSCEEEHSDYNRLIQSANSRENYASLTEIKNKPASAQNVHISRYNNNSESFTICPINGFKNTEKLNSYLNFIELENGNLNEYAHEIKNLALQLAWNNYKNGPVGNEASGKPDEILKSQLLRIMDTRPKHFDRPRILKILHGDSSLVNGIAINSDVTKMIMACHSGNCNLYDLKKGEIIHLLRGHTAPVKAVDMTPDGNKSISCGDMSCILWDLAKGEKVRTFLGHNMPVQCVSMTSDGKKAISGSFDNTCILWDLTSGRILKTLVGHKLAVMSVAITPDGKRAISGSFDKTCILWDLVKGEKIMVLQGHTNHVNSVSFTPDCKKAFTGSSDKTCILWDLNSGTE